MIETNTTEQSFAEACSFDPSLIDDPVAATTNWTPESDKHDGNVQARKLVMKADKLLFKPTSEIILASLVFVVGGGIFVALGAAYYIGYSFAFTGSIHLAFLAGLLFMVMGLFLLHHHTRPIVVDRSLKLIYKGKKPDKTNTSIKDQIINFKDAYAVQIIGSNLRLAYQQSSRCYQIFIVTKDGSRLFLANFEKLRPALKASHILARYAGTKVWNAAFANRQVHPAVRQFNDPIAEKVDWTPSESGGANMKTHTLKQSGSSRIEFLASMKSRLFSLVFVCIGLFVMIAVPLMHLPTVIAGQGSFMHLIGVSFFGSIFFIAGLITYFYFTTPIVFDKGIGYYWRGRRTMAALKKHHNDSNVSPLKDIHAIQIIPETCVSTSSNTNTRTVYNSYEINLVLKDCERMTVIDHSNLAEIRSDAQKLATFLNVPLWDASEILKQ